MTVPDDEDTTQEVVPQQMFPQKGGLDFLKTEHYENKEGCS